MIVGLISLAALAAIILITVFKILNVLNKGASYPDIYKYFGFAGILFSWLFLLFALNANVHLASNDILYEADAFESAQYFSFATNFLLVNIFLTLMEVMQGWKWIFGRERLKRAAQ